MRVLATLVLLTAGAVSAHAQPFANASASLADYTVATAAPGRPCESLSAFTTDGLASISARLVPATADAPQHCRVLGVIAPEVAFEVHLPDRWNRRFYMTGNGGLAGDALDTALNPERAAALVHGFATARTNTGHDARQEPGGTFVLSNPQKAIDYAYRAVHVTADTAKRIAADYYAQPVRFSYWSSCSNGGRQGLLEAQRYPADFDGIVAHAPWVDQTGFTIGAMWIQKAITEAPLAPGKLALLAERVMAACDEADGLKDGLIDDPRRCRFDPTRDLPACREGADGVDCFTAAEMSTIQKIYDGPMSNGRPLFPGFEPGSEAVTTGPNGTASAWLNTIVPAKPGATPSVFNLAQNVMRYLVLDPPQPEYDFLRFDYDRDPALVERWSRLADAKDPGLSAFRRRGGKLLMTYGWADQILQPMMGVTYYEAVLAANGPDATNFARLFMMPGVAHCGGGIGPDRIDAVTAVIDWVETGRAPDSLLATQVASGAVVRTRPLCPYPQVARHTGQGSIDEAANFRCAMP